MLFNDEFLAELKANPTQGVLNLVRVVDQAWDDHRQFGWGEDHLDAAIEAYTLIIELSEAGLLLFPPPTFSITGDTNTVCSSMALYLKGLEKEFSGRVRERTAEILRNRFKLGLGTAFAYEFSQGDFDRIQVLINELRELIGKARGLEKEHQQRLLRRLERLQAEMHKKVSDLDRFWGLLGDAGVAFGKLGNDAKPIVDRIRELAGITWNTQSRAEELPSGSVFPQLEDKTSKEAD